MEQYINEDTIIKTSEYDSFQELLICPICCKLMLEPVMCLDCQNYYCNNCIESWKKKSQSCPNKCKDSIFKPVIEKNRVITKFKFKCVKGCGAEIPFNDIKNHYSSDCLTKNKNKSSKIKLLSKEQADQYKKEGNSLDYMTTKNNYLFLFYSNIIGGLYSRKNNLNKYVRYDYLFLYRFLQGEPSEGAIATVSIDLIATTFQLSDGTIINCHIYDTAGQERYRALGKLYYKKADAVLLVYDITNRKSFENIKKYYVDIIRDNCKKDIIVLLLGNKIDKEEKREVPLEEGVDLAFQKKYEFKEFSCVQNNNVAGAFEFLIESWNFLNNRKQKKFPFTKKEKLFMKLIL